jgi:plasmid maintenance system antidote protein VapI
MHCFGLSAKFDLVHNFGLSAEVWIECTSLILVQRFGLSAQLWTECQGRLSGSVARGGAVVITVL